MIRRNPLISVSTNQSSLLTNNHSFATFRRTTASSVPRPIRGHRVSAGLRALRRMVAYALVATTIGLGAITVAAAAAPGKPTDVRVAIGSNRVTVDWFAPTNNGGSAITGYKVEISTDYQGQSTSSWATLVEDTLSTNAYNDHENVGVLPSLQLCYRISAINADGTSDPSDAGCDTELAILDVPELISTNPVTVKGNRIEMTFDETLDSTSVPRGSLFALNYDGRTGGLRVQTVEIIGAMVILTVDEDDAAKNTDTVRVRYRPPAQSIDEVNRVLIPSTVNALKNGIGTLVAGMRSFQTAQNLTPGPVTVSLSLDMDSIGENVGSTTLTATVSPVSAEDFTLTVSTDPADTADILGLDGTTLSFTAGNTSSNETITITAIDNTVNAPDQKVEISAESGMTYVTIEPVTLTVSDDELSVSFGQSTYSVFEGDAILVTVRLDQDPQGTATIPLTVTPPCAPNEECGYSGIPENLTFASGETVKTITFTSTADEDEDDETVTLGFDDTNFSPSDVSVGTSPTATVTIRERPEVAVSFVEPAYSVSEGESVSVTVRLSEDPLRTVEIPLTTTPPCPDDGECDYEVAQSVMFTSGETEKTITFSATADRMVEGDETVTLGFGASLPRQVNEGSPASAVVTLSENRLLQPSDVNKELLPRITQAMIASTLTAISSRVETDGAASDGAMNLTGSSALKQALALVPSAVEQDSLDMKRALAGKSFALPLNGAAGGLEGLALWGRGDYRDMEGGDDRPIEWDGDLSSIHLGADMRLQKDILAGLAVSWSEGDFDYRGRTGSEGGRYESEMTSVHPYVGWISSKRDLRTWATVGYGRGEVDIEDDSGKHSSDTRLKTGALGMIGHLYSVESLFGYSGTTTVRFKADGHVSEVKADGGGEINPLTSDIRRVRAALEGTHEYSMDGGQMLLPTLEIGLRHDSGDGLEGTGFEIGAGARYTDPSRGLIVEGQGRYLVTHSDDYDEWGFQGSVRVDPGSDRRGLALSLIPSWGAHQSGLDQLWSQDAGSVLSLGQDEPMKGRLNVEVEYGLPALDGRGLLTPYARLSLAGGSKSYRVGSQLEVGTAISLNIEGGRLRDVQGESDYGIWLQSELQF